MRPRVRSVLVGAYLLGCIVVGGSAQNAWTNLALQLAGIGFIAWGCVGGLPVQGGKRASAIHLLLMCALLLVLLQLVPIPARIWSALPGRERIVEGLSLLGYPLRPFPIAEAPHAAVLALFAAIPAIAAFVATERLRPSPRVLAAAIVAAMVAAVGVGAVQVAGGPNSWAYFYDTHNPGAIGFFANANHMATLLLVGIPMAAALVVSPKSTRRSSVVMRYGPLVALVLLVTIGIFLNGSRAALGLSIPVIVVTAALFPAAVRWRGAALIASMVALVGGIALILSNPLSGTDAGAGGSASGIGGRGEIWATTGKAIQDSFPFGTGLGSFESVYHQYENATGVTRSYVNHAHNDYLELALELGAGGVLLIVLFLIWWGIAATRIWTSRYSSPFARAATIATAAILVHSFVDFPLRTGAISAIFGTCIALMTLHLAPIATVQASDSRSSRHVDLG